MNFTVYIEDSIANKVIACAENQGKPRNAIIREALEEWCQKHANVQWEPGFFDFEPVNLSDFSQYRAELKPMDEDPLK